VSNPAAVSLYRKGFATVSRVKKKCTFVEKYAKFGYLAVQVKPLLFIFLLLHF